MRRRQSFGHAGHERRGAERRQRDADRRHWQRRLDDIETELAEEPARVAASYEVRTERLEPIGIGQGPDLR